MGQYRDQGGVGIAEGVEGLPGGKQNSTLCSNTLYYIEQHYNGAVPGASRG